jgi:hypothetical protein
MFDSVRLWLTVRYVVVVGLILVASSITVYVLVARELYERVDAGLRATMEVAISVLRHQRIIGQSFRNFIFLTRPLPSSIMQGVCSEKKPAMNLFMSDYFDAHRSIPGRSTHSLKELPKVMIAAEASSSGFRLHRMVSLM